MRVAITGVGNIGILRDPAPHALPPNAWSDGKNIRFGDGMALPTGRDISILGPLQLPGYFLHNTGDFWVYAGEKTPTTMGVWTIDQVQTHVELSTTIEPQWTALSLITGGNINGLTVLGNRTDSPVYWNGINPVTSKLQWLPWDATNTWNDVSWVAAAIRPHKRWVFALGVDEDGTQHPKRIRNSAAAPPNAIPTTWDDTDTTADAAFVDDAAADRYDLVDGLSLGDEFAAYTNQTTWIGQATGNNDAPFRFRKAFDFVGALSTDCIVAQGRRHFVLTQEDVVVHDGSTVQPLLKENNRRWLFRNIDVSTVDASFLFYSRPTQELWVAFPEQGAAHCTKALVINLIDNGRIGIRDLPNVRSVDMGRAFSTPIVLNYANATFSYGVSAFPYTQTNSAIDAEDRIGISPLDTTGLICFKNYANVTDPSASVPVVQLERSHITFPGESRVSLQDGRILRCTAIYPTFSRQPSGDVNVYLGTSNSAGGNMTWYGPEKYNALTTRNGRVNFRQQGRYLGVRFETTDGADWQLSGYDMDIQPLGHRA